MESKAKILGHPIHPILIPFPLGLLSTSVVFDVVHLLAGNGKWSEVSFWMIAAGVIGGGSTPLNRGQAARAASTSHLGRLPRHLGISAGATQKLNNSSTDQR